MTSTTTIAYFDLIFPLIGPEAQVATLLSRWDQVFKCKLFFSVVHVLFTAMHLLPLFEIGRLKGFHIFSLTTED
jgi:hypothetical protein